MALCRFITSVFSVNHRDLSLYMRWAGPESQRLSAQTRMSFRLATEDENALRDSPCSDEEGSYFHNSKRRSSVDHSRSSLIWTALVSARRNLVNQKPAVRDGHYKKSNCTTTQNVRMFSCVESDQSLRPEGTRNYREPQRGIPSQSRATPWESRRGLAGSSPEGARQSKSMPQSPSKRSAIER